MTKSGAPKSPPVPGRVRQAQYEARRRERKAAADAELAARAPQQPALFQGDQQAAPAAGSAGAKWRAYCVERFGSTLVAQHRMAAWAASQSLGELAAALGCDRLTAWRELRAVLADVTPFLHAKAPVDPGETPPGAIQVIIAPGLAAALDAEDARTITVSGTQVARNEQ